jgi:hypothetical protein
MNLRCHLHVNGDSRKLVLVPSETETLEHLALKLSAALLFWDHGPGEVSLKHPALMGQEFLPDLACFDETGAFKLWIECGKVALHKLGKLTRRIPDSRIVVLKSSEADARRFRADVSEQLERGGRVEVLSWRAADFKAWLSALSGREQAEAFGESAERSLNVVLNERPFAVDILSF